MNKNSLFKDGDILINKYTIKIDKKWKFKIYSRVNIGNDIDKQLIKAHDCFDTYENAEKVLNKIILRR